MRLGSKTFVEVGEDEERSAPVDGDSGRALRRARGRSEERRSVEMICMTVEIREGALMHRALKITRDGKTDRKVRLDFPIDPEAFFVPEGSDQREAA